MGRWDRDGCDKDRDSGTRTRRTGAGGTKTGRGQNRWGRDGCDKDRNSGTRTGRRGEGGTKTGKDRTGGEATGGTEVCRLEQVRQKQRPFSLSGVKLTPRRLPPLISFSSGIVVMVVAASRGSGGGSVPVGEELWLTPCTPLLVHTAVHTAVP